MFGIQPIHILIIALVALLIFGPKRLPKMGQSIGKAINEFRNSTTDMTDILRDEISTPGDPGITKSFEGINKPVRTPVGSVPFETPSIAPVPVRNFCIQCGAQKTPGALFCNQCGTKFPEKAG